MRQYWLNKKALKGRARLRSKNDPLECICDDCWDCCIIEAPEPNANEEEFKCNQCTYVAKHNKHLKDHIKEIHDKIKDNKCPSCNFATSRKSSLTKHMQIYHEKDHIIEAPEPNANEEEFKCNQCTYVAKHRKNLIRHIKAIHDKIKDKKCPSCNYATSAKYKLKNHIERYHEKVNCDMCGYECDNVFLLRNHIKTHNWDKDNTEVLNCNQCTYVTKNRKILKDHIKVMHDKIKDVKCPSCSYAACTKETLSKHMKRCHKNCHMCSSCPYAAPNELHLAEHINKYHDKREPVNAENKPKEIKISDCHSMAEGSHPPYINMVKEAITATNPTEGTSRQAIIKYIRANYNVGHPLSTISKQVSDTLNIHCSMGDLVRATGCGASGSFKLASQRKVKCDLCGYVCNNETHLANHVKVVHKTSDKLNAATRPTSTWSRKPSRQPIRRREHYKHHQLRIMKAHFQTNQYPDSERLKMLSQETNIDKKVLQVSDVIIKFWQNLLSIPTIPKSDFYSSSSHICSSEMV